MANISYEKRQLITSQALNEMVFARQFKQGKVSNWKLNEDMYYGRKRRTDESRANIDLGKMAGFVHTLLSKVDNPLIFKFGKRKDAQLKRARRLNALREYDRNADFWDMKDIVGKKQGIIYGRAIYSYYADSVNGYRAHLDNVDVYDYLIDPSAGGIDIENAQFMGRYGVVKSRSDLKKGVKDRTYLKTETERLLEGSGFAGDASQEETNKMSRTYDTNVYTAQKNISNPDRFPFWEWYTTYEGERYYLLLQEGGATAIRVEKLTDLFPATKQHPLGAFPFWTWAAFPDLTEFWTPSYCDYVREPFMGQNVTINQMFDNGEAINNPQKVVRVGAIENLSELKFRRNGIIRVKGEFDIDQAYQTVKVASIDTPLAVYDKLEQIQEKASGVTAGSQGLSDEDKVGIYEGNEANAADRFGLLNKSYSNGYKRFASLYEEGAREHLTRKVAVDILGPDGVELEYVSRRDIFRKDESFTLMVEASNAETALSEADKRTKIAFLGQNAVNPIQNPKKAYELAASIAGFGEEEIRQLLDVSEFGDEELMSEAERDIEGILDGKDVKPNAAATTAYKQRFIDYMRDNEEDIDDAQFAQLSGYVASLDGIIMANLQRTMSENAVKQAALGGPQSPQGALDAPVADGGDITGITQQI